VSEAGRWYAGNDEYLVAALAWLRLKLGLLAQQGPVAPRKRAGFFERAEEAPSPPGEGQVRWAFEAMQAAGARLQPPPVLWALGERLGLSPFEGQVLLLCAAMEFDTRIPELCNQAHGRSYPTFALALSLFDNPAWDVLSPERPLRYWRLLEISQPAAQPLTTSALRADERIVNALKGLHYLDDRLSPLVFPLPTATVALPPSQQSVAEAAVEYLRRNQEQQPWPLLELVGPDTRSVELVARQVASSLNVPFYRLPLDLIPTGTADLETLARLWQRENLLAPVALYLEAHELDEKSSQYTALQRFLGRSDGVMILGTREVWPNLSGLGRQALLLDVGKPTSLEQRQAWVQALGGEAEGTSALLAGQFDLNLEAIQQVARESLGATDPPPLAERLWDGCRTLARPRLETLAQRIQVKADWSRLVLPQAETSLLAQIADQVRRRGKVYEEWGFGASMNRGLGISALFAGESGTGKTLAAEVIAHELRLDLYRIDLSSVVSKYIGETEKNLRRLFDAAEDGGAILFFDEADALFGKRSEVKDAHDRYANIEINYLLQRMEAYRGLAILATNMKSSLDSAFTRRLRFIVNFPFPGVAERQEMWQRAFPAQARVSGLDYARLARLNLTGAGIHNTVLGAAFLAARAGRAIGMREVLEAARTEFKKLERPVNEADFRYEVGA